MFEELTKKSFKKCLFTAIVLLVIGAGLVGFSALTVFYTIFGYVDFTQLEPNEIRNQLVEVDLYANFGCFMEEYEKNTNTGATRTTYLWYVIWTGDDYSTDYRYMAIKVPASYEKRMEAMADNSFNGYYSDAIHFIGRIKKMSSEDYSYFKDYFIDSEDGWTLEEFEDYTLPYYIDYFHDSFSVGIFYILIFVGGIVLIILGIFRIIKGKSGGFLKKLREDIRISGYPDNYIESDYASSQRINDKDDIKMGRLMTYYHLGSTYRAVPHNKIMWAYQNTITHRTNGIKTGTSYNVTYHVDGYKNSIDLCVTNEAAAQEILKRLNSTCPWIVVGYTDELKRMYNQNRAEFLQLRYNTVEHNPTDTGFGDLYGQQGTM